jgi:putative DNA methylase
MSVIPLAWKDRPSLIERILPAQKISAEAQKERKAGAGQTLTALGSYWKGRKPLILAKACVLGALLPATGNDERDLDVFEKLMAMDDEAFLRREFRPSCLELVQRLHPAGQMSRAEAERLFVVRRRKKVERKTVWSIEPFIMDGIDELGRAKGAYLQWSDGVEAAVRHCWNVKWVQTFTYLERVSGAKRPEEIDQNDLFEPIWDQLNAHLGTSAQSIPEVVEQLGILRFGHRPKVGDTFCGGGSIPFEAARLGCDVYASDLNPIACLLTWGALNIIGADRETRRAIERAQAEVAAAVDREITELGIEHDRHGNRAKAFLYCLETPCPPDGWMVPLSPSWVVSTSRRVIARLVPDHQTKRFRIDILSGVSDGEMEEANRGTVQGKDVVYTLDGETYRIPIKTIRGDFRLPDGSTGNKLRRWEKDDYMPRPDDIFQERLYCIQWITKDTLHKHRQETFFAAVTEDDRERDNTIERLVHENLAGWQRDGLVPDMPIEPGNKTTEPIRTRGWTYWHHLFTPRALVTLAVFRERVNGVTSPCFLDAINFSSRLCRWETSAKGTAGDGAGKRTGGASDNSKDVFSNQALNTLFDYSLRSCYTLLDEYRHQYPDRRIANVATTVDTNPACMSPNSRSSLWITDPPYADAIRYEEITEFFIAWLRKRPSEPFKEWTWDSRRALAIKGSGAEFRRDMIAAYRAMAEHMPDNGLQIIMFTHQDAGVWADMAAIVWGAGLQVTAAWYIATETTSELKKGGYVQGTVLLVVRKRLNPESAYRDELVQEVRSEVARQIETMVGLNQKTKGHGRSENLFEDADLQMAGYAASLRVLTGYSRIDGHDMVEEAIRPREKGTKDIVKEIIDFAVQVANEYLVPEGLPRALWERLSGPERFYFRMLDIEAAGLKKIDNYQNFAKAFRYADYASVMASTKPNDARLKTAADFKRTEFDTDFGKTALRALLFALYEIEREVDVDEVMSHLHDFIPGYFTRRDDLMAMASFLAAKRETRAPAEAQAARILLGRIKNERLG